MLPSSAIQIAERSPSRLVILDPPFYGLGLFLIILGVILLAAAAVLFPAFRAGRESLWLVLPVAAIPLVTGAALLTSRSYVVLSHENGLVEIQDESFGKAESKRQIPLQEVRAAAVEPFSNTRRLVLVLQSGGVVPLTSATSRGGHQMAANAINDFLAGRGAR
jgi:hypothetical protein